MELKEFLSEARKNTWAGNLGKNESGRTGSEGIFIFEKDGLRYEDEYFGRARFQGEEIVYFQDKPIWGMVYCGGIPFGVDVNKTEEFDFLKKALLERSDTARISGKTEFQDPKRTYLCEIKGDLDNFSGKEIIKHKNVITHEVIFLGGNIK